MTLPGLLGEGVGAGEEGGGVAIGAHAEEEKVVAVAWFAEAGGELGEAGVVCRRRPPRGEFALDAEDVAGRDGDVVEQCFCGP